MTAPRPTPSFSLARAAAVCAIAAVVITCAHFADRAVFLNVHAPDAANEDWARLLRIAGYVPTWLCVAAAFALIDRRAPGDPFPFPLRDRWSRAASLTLAIILAGLLAEGIKLIVRRERPSLPDAAYHFRAFTDAPWSTSGLGMPSSHTAIAFAAATILARVHPRAAPILFLIALGCALTRILARAHYTSDTAVGALVGIAAGSIAWALHLRTLRTITPEVPR